MFSRAMKVILIAVGFVFGCILIFILYIAIDDHPEWFDSTIPTVNDFPGLIV